MTPTGPRIKNQNQRRAMLRFAKYMAPRPRARDVIVHPATRSSQPTNSEPLAIFRGAARAVSTNRKPSMPKLPWDQ